MNVLMLSSSKVDQQPYLAQVPALVASHMPTVKFWLFVPYAGVTLSWDAYTQQVQQALPDLQIRSIHQYADAKQAVAEAEGIMVGGGNTFQLLNQLYRLDLISLIQTCVRSGVPYVGWSAGSNICGATIKTTNDMPIVQPPSFNALAFLPFQLNPHYIDVHPAGFHGETRAQRLAEFCQLNPTTPVIGLREGSTLYLNQVSQQPSQLRLLGERPAALFLADSITPLPPLSDISALLIA
ncbi:MAG: dipeptidase PepE [Paraglaciecola sp.]|nr:dipeptidase PepE [Paraglaciecola sp.]NCT47676.1 dipeptidase PepE [Paraglaciecola sp.]